MRSKITGEAEYPRNIEYTICITCTIEDWKRFQESIRAIPQGNQSYPTWHILERVSDVINHAQQHFETKIKDGND
jgi:hypothetical protein